MEMSRQPQDYEAPQDQEEEEEKIVVDAEGQPELNPEEAEIQLGLMGTY